MKLVVERREDFETPEYNFERRAARQDRLYGGKGTGQPSAGLVSSTQLLVQYCYVNAA